MILILEFPIFPHGFKNRTVLSKAIEIGQTDILETPDFKSKLFITSSTISPMQIIPSLSKSIRAWSHIKLCFFNDFLKKD